MSSYPFKSGLPIINNPLYSFPNHFILRSQDERTSMEKLKRLEAKLPAGAEMQSIRIGFRPDHPAPVAAFFTEVIIKGNTEGGRSAVFV